MDLSDVESNRTEQLKSIPLKGVLSELMHSIRAYVNIKFEDRSTKERERLVREALDGILKLSDDNHSLGKCAEDFVVETKECFNPVSDWSVVEMDKSESPNLVTRIVRFLENKNKATNGQPNAANIPMHEAPVPLKKEHSGIIIERTNDFLSVLRFFENK